MKEQELAVPVGIQQAASLYGISSTIVGTGKVSNKKSLKYIVKVARKLVLDTLGKEAGWDIMKANKDVIEKYLDGIKKDPRLDVSQSRNLYQVAIDELTDSCMTGAEKLF